MKKSAKQYALIDINKELRAEVLENNIRKNDIRIVSSNWIDELDRVFRIKKKQL